MNKELCFCPMERGANHVLLSTSKNTRNITEMQSFSFQKLVKKNIRLENDNFIKTKIDK